MFAKGRTLQISQQANFRYQIDTDVPCHSQKQRKKTEIKKGFIHESCVRHGLDDECFIKKMLAFVLI